MSGSEDSEGVVGFCVWLLKAIIVNAVFWGGLLFVVWHVDSAVGRIIIIAMAFLLVALLRARGDK